MACGFMFHKPESKQQVYNCRELSLEFNKINNKGNKQNHSILLSQFPIYKKSSISTLNIITEKHQIKNYIGYTELEMKCAEKHINIISSCPCATN
jgi:hypothetical protein